MKVSIPLAILWLSLTTESFAQIEPPAQNSSAAAKQAVPPSANPTQPEPQNPHPVLPDSPIPIVPNLQDGPFPCPFGNGRPCALLGGRLYFRDLSHLTEHDATGKAMRNPLMLVGEGLRLASAIADAEGSQACQHVHTCREGNPLLGSNPSRAESYGLLVPFEVGTFVLESWLKKHGRGTLCLV